MSKPRIKLVRRADFKQPLWECRGHWRRTRLAIGRGLTPKAAYDDWKSLATWEF